MFVWKMSLLDFALSGVKGSISRVEAIVQVRVDSFSLALSSSQHQNNTKLPCTRNLPLLSYQLSFVAWSSFEQPGKKKAQITLERELRPNIKQ